MTSSIEGVKFSDTLAALLVHAAAHGFRVEADGRGRKAQGVVVYPPDKNFPPITVAERDAKLNRAHYENIRRDLYRAGLEPLPTDQPVQPEPTQETPMASKPTVKHVHLTQDQMNRKIAPGQPDRASVIAGVVDGLFSKADLEPIGSLMAGIIYSAVAWADAPENAIVDGSEVVPRADLDEALRMTQEANDVALRLQSQLDASDRKLAKAVDDCAAALRRAEEAEAKSAAAEAAMAPLRAFLNGGVS